MQELPDKNRLERAQPRILQPFQRLVDPDPSTRENGVIPVGHLEVAQLENNPNDPGRGRLLVSAGGGQ